MSESQFDTIALIERITLERLHHVGFLLEKLHALAAVIKTPMLDMRAIST